MMLLHSNMRIAWKRVSIILLLVIAGSWISLASEKRGSIPPASGDQHIKVYVYDAESKSPMELARVILRRDRVIIGTSVTNPAGMAQFVDIEEK